jgi:hypothetical protein
MRVAPGRAMVEVQIRASGGTMTTPAAAEPSGNVKATGGSGNPTLRLSPRIRLWIYILTAFGSIVVAYGNAKGWDWLGDAELAAWSSLVALVNGLAAFNVKTTT